MSSRSDDIERQRFRAEVKEVGDGGLVRIESGWAHPYGAERWTHYERLTSEGTVELVVAVGRSSVVSRGGLQFKGYVRNVGFVENDWNNAIVASGLVEHRPDHPAFPSSAFSDTGYLVAGESPHVGFGANNDTEMLALQLVSGPRRPALGWGDDEQVQFAVNTFGA